MRALVASLALALVAAGCIGGGSSIVEPVTNGDRGLTAWHIDDGLCDGGLLGGECDLSQHVAVGGQPTVIVTARNGTDLSGAHLSAGPGIVLRDVSSSTDDHGVVTLNADVGVVAAGIADVLVLDASGHEIDRAHITFVVASSLECGLLGPGVTRDLSFHALSTQPVTLDVGGTTTLACRANDEAGQPLLTVAAIAWSVTATDTTPVTLHDDSFFSLGPPFGGTIHANGERIGTATVHTALGSASTDLVVNVR